MCANITFLMPLLPQSILLRGIPKADKLAFQFIPCLKIVKKVSSDFFVPKLAELAPVDFGL